MENILTVIIPVFNDEVNIVRCLESLYNQSLKGIEIIVVNDASTDGTLSVLEAYQQMHEFKIISMDKNSGAGACRNEGILSAHTPYITFVDSDDWVDISTYASCFEQPFNNPDIIVYGLAYDYVMYNHREAKYSYSRTYKMSGEFALSIYSHAIPNEIGITPIVNNKVYMRKFLLDNKLFFHEKLRYQEDDVFTFEVLAKASTVVFVSGGQYHYCQRNGSLIHCISEGAIGSFIEAYLALEESLKRNHLFVKYKREYYLKFKSSLLGVVKRIFDYEPNLENQDKLVHSLLILLFKNFDILEILKTIDYSAIRCIL